MGFSDFRFWDMVLFGAKSYFTPRSLNIVPDLLFSQEISTHIGLFDAEIDYSW